MLAHAAAPEDRSRRARRVAGLTEKQAALLGVVVAYAHEDEGVTSRDCEAVLARTSPQTGIVGWAASDCTIGLNRLVRRGLVERERLVGVKPGQGQARLAWRATEAGERAYREWLEQSSPEFADWLAFAVRARARASSEESAG